MSGKATASGIKFQEDVGVWLACQVLAGKERTPLLDLPPSTYLLDICAETYQPIDDLLVNTTDNSRLLFQCKTTLSISESTESSFHEVFDQFVRQYQLKRGRDKFVLAVSDRSSNRLRVELRGLLKCLRNTKGKVRQEVIAGIPTQQAKLLDLVERVIKSCFIQNGSAGTAAEVADVLSATYIMPFDFSENGQSKQLAVQLLQHTILTD